MNEIAVMCPGRSELLAGAVAVPPSGPWVARPARRLFSVCNLCHGPAKASHHLCWSCATALGQLGTSVPRVVPIFLFALGSGAHSSLVGYKGSPSPAARAARSEALAGLLQVFLAKHRRCLLADAPRPVALVPVPSTRGGRRSWGGTHPLVEVCRAAAAAASSAVTAASPEHLPSSFEVLDVLRAAPTPPRRLLATRRGFALDGEPITPATRAIVVEDVFASGSRALSAAAALEEAGVDVAAVLPIGRLVRPEHNSVTAAFWRAVARAPADAGRCCACTRRRGADACACAADHLSVLSRLAA